MKKIVIGVILVGAFIFGYKYSYVFDGVINKIPIINTLVSPSQQVVDKDKEIKRLQDELGKYTKKEHEEELRKKRLRELQSAEIVQGEFEDIGALVVYRNRVTYSDIIPEKLPFWRERELYVDLIYRYGIAMDFSQIKFNNFQNGVWYVPISKDGLYREYCELEEIKDMKTEKTILTKDFSSTDTGYILMDTKKATEEKIDNSPDIFDQAFENLKAKITEKIDEICKAKNIEYTKIIFTQE